MDAVPLLNPTEDTLRRGIQSLPIIFIQGILLHIQSCALIPNDVNEEWFVDRLIHEIEDVGLELFIQKLDPETIQESCSLLNLGANEEELSQLQVSLEAYAKEQQVNSFLESLDTEILERYCSDLKIHHKTAAPKEEIEATLTSEILLLGLEGLLNFLTIPLLREYYTALHIGTTAPSVLKKRQLIEEIVLHSFSPSIRHDGIQVHRVTPEPIIEVVENENENENERENQNENESEDSDHDPQPQPNLLYKIFHNLVNCVKDSDYEPSTQQLLTTPKTPYTTPRRLTAVDIKRNTPRKELDKMLVKDLRIYLQTQGLKYDDKRSVLLNRIMRHHKSDAGPATPLEEDATNHNNNSKLLGGGLEEEDEEDTSSHRKSKRATTDSDSASSSSGSSRKKVRTTSS